MTRDTQLRAYLKERNIPLDSLEANSIIEGIEWADNHPSDKWHKEAIKVTKEWLKDQYAMICEFYARELNRMWDTDGDWIRDNYCTFEVADCYISNEELRLLVDNKVEWETFYEWYTYATAMHYGEELGKKDAVVINLSHWLKGYPEEMKVPKEEWEKWEKEYFDNEFNKD